MSEFLTNHFRAPFFEGWYYKLVNAAKDQCVVVIPGLSCPEDKEGQCFIQVGRWPEAGSKSINYPLTTLWSKQDGREVHIGNSRFSPTDIDIDIEDAGKNVAGYISFTNNKPLRRNILSPGVMGPFSYVPRMQCNHSIISMDSDLDGQLFIDDQLIDFTGGKGYIERNWGKDFPKNHLWIQSNHFDRDIKSLTCAVADVPAPWGGFQGFFCIAVLDNGKELRFATYTGAKIAALTVDGNNIFLEITSAKKRIRITTESQLGVQLHAPQNGDMVREITENLGATVMVEISDKDGKIIASATGSMAGVETEGIAQ